MIVTTGICQCPISYNRDLPMFNFLQQRSANVQLLTTEICQGPTSCYLRKALLMGSHCKNMQYIDHNISSFRITLNDNFDIEMNKGFRQGFLLMPIKVFV